MVCISEVIKLENNLIGHETQIRLDRLDITQIQLSVLGENRYCSFKHQPFC